MDLNSRRILDPALAEHLALIEDTDEIADAVADLLGLVILRPDDYVPKKVVSYVYLWINFTRLRAGDVPFLYIGSRRKPKKRKYVNPVTDNYLSSSEVLRPDIKKGDDCQRYILATFEDDPEEHYAYDLEEVILTGIDCRAAVEFYNMYNGGRGFVTETASDIAKTTWANPDHRSKMSDRLKKRWQDPEYKVKMSKHLTSRNQRMWERPKYRSKMTEKIKQHTTSLWENPNSKFNSREYSEKQRAGMLKRYADPNSHFHSDEYRQFLSESRIKHWQDEEKRAAHIKGIEKSWQDPQVAAARSKDSRTEPFQVAHKSYYDEWSRRVDSNDFEHCDGCGKVITVEPIREAGKITCFFCENPVQGA